MGWRLRTLASSLASPSGSLLAVKEREGAGCWAFVRCAERERNGLGPVRLGSHFFCSFLFSFSETFITFEKQNQNDSNQLLKFCKNKSLLKKNTLEQNIRFYILGYLKIDLTLILVSFEIRVLFLFEPILQKN